MNVRDFLKKTSLNPNTLLDAMHPEKYPQLTIRVSNYAVDLSA